MRFSICIPTYNRKEILQKTVDEILESNNLVFDLVVCDNFSTDGTEEFCKDKQKKDGRFKYYRNERNIGISGNIQKCIENSETDYIYLLSDEDKLTAEMINSTLDKIEKGYNLILPSVYDTNKRELYIKRKNKLHKKINNSLLLETHTYISGIIFNRKCLNIELLRKLSKIEDNIYHHIPIIMMTYLKGKCLTTDEVLCLKGDQEFRKSYSSFTLNSEDKKNEDEDLPFYHPLNRIKQLNFFSTLISSVTESKKYRNLMYSYFGRWAVIIFNSDFIIEKYGSPSDEIISKVVVIEGIGKYYKYHSIIYTLIKYSKFLIKKIIFWEELKRFRH